MTKRQSNAFHALLSIRLIRLCLNQIYQHIASYVIGEHKNYYVRHTGLQIEKLIGTNSFEVYTILGHFSLLKVHL